MKRLTTSLFIAGALALTLFTVQRAVAQDVVAAPDPRASPMSLAQITLDDGTYVKVHYSSPRKRGRDIFGGLVPFKEVWRFGANEATELTVTGPVAIGGEEIEPGTYAVFAVPDEGEWTLILNKNLGQWGAFSYDEAQDYKRITVPAEQGDQSYEAFTITLDEREDGSGAVMNVAWDTTRLSIPIESRG